MSTPATTRPSTLPASGRRGLLRALMAAVRPEFRADSFVFPADDPVFGGGACRVEDCPRSARGRGLCPGHLQRWVDAGRPDLAVFAASTDPRWRRQQPNQRCRVSGCGYGSTRVGMCQLHAQRWERAGRPDLDGWLAAPPAVKQPESGASCRIGHCTLWPHAGQPFCHSHANTWKANGRGHIDEFAARFTEPAPTADETVRLDQLGAQPKLEMQYVLQARHDERRGKVTPSIVMRVVRLLARAPVTSLTDHTEQEWRQHCRPALNDSRSRAFLGYAYRTVADLAENGGWEAEYPRDVWQLRRLGFAGGRMLRFDGIAQPWLRHLTKRWTRWRISTGLGLEAAARPVRVITRFAQFLDNVGVEQITQIDRPVLERYLVDLHTEMAGSQRHGSHIGLLGSFFAAIPPAPVGQRPAGRRDVLRRGLSQARRAASPGAGRARHGPAGERRQP